MAIDLQSKSAANTDRALQDANAQAEKDAETKKQTLALQGFKDALKQI